MFNQFIPNIFISDKYLTNLIPIFLPQIKFNKFNPNIFTSDKYLTNSTPTYLPPKNVLPI